MERLRLETLHELQKKPNQSLAHFEEPPTYEEALLYQIKRRQNPSVLECPICGLEPKRFSKKKPFICMNSSTFDLCLVSLKHRKCRQCKVNLVQKQTI